MTDIQIHRNGRRGKIFGMLQRKIYCSQKNANYCARISEPDNSITFILSSG